MFPCTHERHALRLLVRWVTLDIKINNQEQAAAVRKHKPCMASLATEVSIAGRAPCIQSQEISQLANSLLRLDTAAATCGTFTTSMSAVQSQVIGCVVCQHLDDSLLQFCAPEL